jgi:hypothetical protein
MHATHAPSFDFGGAVTFFSCHILPGRAGGEETKFARKSGSVK